MSPRPHSRKSFKSTLAAALLAAAAVTVMPARSFAQEEQAQALYDDAMDNDYLNTKFDDAAAKLNKAVKQCGKKCSKTLLGKLYVALAVVNGAGKGGNKAAKAAFEKAFKADKNAKPLDLYFTDELRKLFEAARKSASGGAEEATEEEAAPKKPAGGEAGSSEAGGEASTEEAPAKKPKSDEEAEDGAAAGGAVNWRPPAEAQVNTPLPVFIPVEDGLGAVSAKLRYKPFGETKWLAVSMRKLAGGFGAEIPCAHTNTTGKLKLYIFLKDKDGEPVAQAGSAKAPLEVSIKNKISGDQPSLPGEKAPEKCSSVECPPDFPGCKGNKSGGERDGKGWGATCESTGECKSGFVCLNGSCEQGESSESGSSNDSSSEEKETSTSGGAKLPSHLVTAGLQLDVLFLSSTNDVCGAFDSGFASKPDNFSCFLPDDGGEFIGRPAKGAANQVLGGGAVGGGRLLVGYDFNFGRLGRGLDGFTAGARLGYAFGGSPSIGDVEERYQQCQDAFGDGCNLRKPSALNFLPAHAELQLKWFPIESLSSAGSLYEPRPYIFTGFGVGQVNAGVPITVCDLAGADGQAATGASSEACPSVNAATERRKVDAFQITGLNFVPVGIGAVFPVHENFGINVELKAMFMVPTAGTVLAPFIGPVGMF